MPAYRYVFDESADFDSVRANLELAIASVEALHGETAARMDARHQQSVEHGVIVVDASTEIGRDLNRLFTGYLRRELGGVGFEVERLVSAGLAPSSEAAA